MGRKLIRLTIAGLVSLVVMAGALVTDAVADSWERLGYARFTDFNREAVVDMHFDGRLDRIAFRARDRSARCEMIRISFANGDNQEIRDRRFQRDNRRSFDLDDGNRRIVHIHFDCRPVGRGVGKVRMIIFGR